MAAQLRKCISLAPSEPELDGSARLGEEQDYRNCLDLVRDSGSTWLKLWARWSRIQPLAPSQVPWEALPDPAVNPGARYVQALDAQIALARAQDPPLGVILQSYEFPRWANDTPDSMGVVERSLEDFELHPGDRMTREDYEGRKLFRFYKPLSFRVPRPEELGVDGAWGGWVRFLYGRYSAHGAGFALDLLNEPNLQWWPQRDPSPTGDRFAPGAVSSPALAARMMQTAQAVAAEHGHPAYIGAPGVSDLMGPGEAHRRLHTGYAEFVEQTLAHLAEAGFDAHERFLWTHHNYADVEEDLGEGGAGPSRAADLRRRLSGRWTGAGGESPRVWITEGGVRVNRYGGEQAQNRLMKRAWARMAGEADGAGIEMMANYLLYSKETYDSGLLNPTLRTAPLPGEVPGAPRIAFGSWRDFPASP